MADHRNNINNNATPESEKEIDFYCPRVNDIDTEAVGYRLQTIRNSYSLTLQEMAKVLEMSYGNVRKLESGEAFPSGKALVLLHEKLGVDLVWLLYGRHSLSDDILSALYTADNQTRFNIFTRLFSYFVAHDTMAFVPAYGRCPGVEHFAKWNETYYRPLEPGELPENEVKYKNEFVAENAKRTPSELIDGLTQRDKLTLLSMIGELLDK